MGARRPAPGQSPATRYFMSFQYFAGAACRALTARKDGPSLYDVCDPVLPGPASGDPHLAKFYKTALGNPALRIAAPPRRAARVARRGELARLREALVRARDDAEPDWAAVGQPVADLVDSIALDHPKPPPAIFTGARAATSADRRRDPRLRAASARLVPQERFPADLCRLQPDRRPRFPRARTD